MSPMFRKKPVVIEARLWEGGPVAATPIINWILVNGGTARWHESGAEAADPLCPMSEYHETHHYCPSCAFTTAPEQLSINTLEGTMRAEIGDWVIRGVQGEFYPCKPDIFEATYEEVTKW